MLKRHLRRGNHASFYDAHGEEVAPARTLMAEAVTNGFAQSFASRAAAEADVDDFAVMEEARCVAFHVAS